MNLRSLNKFKEMREEKNSSLKGNDTLSDIIQGLSKNEDDKYKMKNAKKIKNKKLQLSNANSDLDINESLKQTNTKGSAKMKSWNKELKPMKSKNKYNFSIQKYPSTTSPRNLIKFTANTSANTNGVNTFSNTYSTFRVDNKIRKQIITGSSNNISNTIEKVKSQATLIQSDLQNLPPRKLSEDFNNINKPKDSLPRKDSSDRLQSSPIIYKDKIESAASLLNHGTFSPSTSSQSTIIIS
jgi:hypothetical protein